MVCWLLFAFAVWGAGFGGVIDCVAVWLGYLFWLVGYLATVLWLICVLWVWLLLVAGLDCAAAVLVDLVMIWVC